MPSISFHTFLYRHLKLSLTVIDEKPLEVQKTRKFNDVLIRLCNAVYNKNTKENGQKVRSPVSLKNVTSESLKTTEVLLLMLELPTFIILYFSIVSDVNLIKFFGQIGTIFGEIDPQLLTIRRIIEAVRAKDLEETFLFVDILRSIWFHTQWKDGGNPKRIFTTKIMFNNNTHTQAMICSSVGDSGFFDIVIGVW